MRKRFFILIIVLAAIVMSGLLTHVAEGGGRSKMRNIRKSVIAGTWYPGDPEKLKSEVKRYLDTVKEKEVRIDGEIIGLIAPHAGYMYSGPVAAYAYRTLKKGQFKRVLILAPSLSLIHI